ncbi:MAG: hypothetical protein QXY62_05020 [Candidatus Altiarchaeota archaeon]
MAEKYTKKYKSEEKRKRKMLIFVLLASIIMIFSGFYYGGLTYQNQQVKQTTPQLFNQYNVQEIFDLPILTKIKSKTNDFIITFPAGAFPTIEMIKLFLNFSNSEEKINYASCDSTDKYFLCTLNTKNENLSLINEHLSKIFPKYILRRAFIAELSEELASISGINETYLIADVNSDEDTYSKAWVYKRDILGSIAFEEKKLPKIERIPAVVLNISKYTISGTFDELPIENFLREINISKEEIEFSQPKILVNSTIESETLSNLNSLYGVNLTTQKNITIISFNSSLQEIRKILSEKNLTYEFEKGKLQLSVSPSRDISKIKAKFAEYKITEISVKKQGTISFSDEVVSDGRVIKIGDSSNYTSTLEEKTNVSDKINISLAVIKFGNQIIPISAKEIP